MRYHALVSSLSARLREVPRLTIGTLSAKPGLPADVAARLAESGIVLPRAMMEFYEEMNGFELEWQYGEGPESVCGDIRLLPLENVFGGVDGMEESRWDDRVFRNVLWFDDDDKSEKRRLQPFKIIDNLTGVSMSTVIRLGGPERVELLFENRRRYLPLSVSFEEYIQAAFLAAGICYWQFELLTPEQLDMMNVESTFRVDFARVFPSEMPPRLVSTLHPPVA